MARRWTNWARTVQSTPASFETPSSDEEVASLVRDARSAGRRVKVVGAGHSWSAIAAPESVCISLDRMQAVVEVGEATATVEAGIRLHRLNEELAARARALTIIGSVTAQSLAGVLSTGTHGSSRQHGNIASGVRAIRLVDGTGEIHDIAEDDPRFAGSVVGLGAVGVVTRVEINVEPAFQLVETTEAIPFENAVREIDAISASAEYVKLWWLPHTDQVVVFRYARTEDAGQPSAFGAWLDEKVVNQLVFAGLLSLSNPLPGLIPAINRQIGAAYLKPRRRVGRSDRLLSLAMPPRHREMEYAIPVEHTAEALRQMRALIVDEDLRVNFIQEVRFVKADPLWMSPAHERDVCQLGAYMAESRDIGAFFAGFEARMHALGGRPHWGKELACSPDEIRAMWRMTDHFQELRAALDPDGVFDNPFLDRVLPRPARG